MNPLILLDKIKGDFPRLTWRRFQYIGVGWDHDVIILDKRIVFRFARNEDVKKGFDNENKLLNYLAPRLKMKIPVYKYIANDKSFYGYEIVPGKQLREWFYTRQLTKRQKTICRIKVAEFLSQLHAIPKNIIDTFKFEKEGTVLALIQGTKMGVQKNLVGRLNKREVSIIQNFLGESESIFQLGFPNCVLIHGDVGGGHILWDSKTETINMIDFSDFNYFDPAYDYSYLFQYGPKFIKDVYNHYTGSKDPNFLKRAEIFWKERTIRHMIRGLTGDPACNFEKCYEAFKEIFKIKK